MPCSLSRREVICGLGATVALQSFTLPRVYAFDSIWGTIGGALAVGLFPGAALALGGFETIQLLGNANSLVDQTKNLETHIDQVLTQVSEILQGIKQFVEACNTALQDIDSLIKQLPQELSKELNELAVKQALGKLQGHTALMSQYLQSREAIYGNADTIRALCDSIVEDVNGLDALQSNSIQFTIHSAPAIATWVQGYTAYNATLKPANRLQDPWSHPVVKDTAVPSYQKLFGAIQAQSKEYSNLDSTLPLEPGFLYTFDGSKFNKTDRPFSGLYQPGSIDNAVYYTIYPEKVQMPANAPFIPLGSPEPGDLCVLGQAPPGIARYWLAAAPPTVIPSGASPDVVVAGKAFSAYLRILRTQTNNVIAFDQLTQGWQLFQTSVQKQLVEQAANTWHNMPVMPKPKRKG